MPVLVLMVFGSVRLSLSHNWFNREMEYKEQGLFEKSKGQLVFLKNGPTPASF